MAPNQRQSGPQRGGPQRSGRGGPGRRGPGGRGGDRGRAGEVRDEFKERVLDMRRVTRVVKGGKRFRFRATLVVGDMAGRVGVGIGKGVDVQQAVMKAKTDAKKALIRLSLKDNRTLHHEVTAKYSAA